MARLAFHMHCDKTTEAGEDEVYFIVTTKKSDGASTSYRLPGNESHWDMNDNGETPDVDVDLIHFELAQDERMTVIVTVMEEDGGGLWSWLDFSNELAGQVHEGGISDLTGLLEQFLPDIQDTDDFIGMFRIDLWNEGDTTHTQKALWSAVERCNFLGQSSGPRSNGYRFFGDGSNYYGWGELFLGND